MTENLAGPYRNVRREAVSRGLTATLLLLSALLWAAVALSAPAGGDYVITRSTIDGGGGRSSGGNFTLTGTIGQPEAQAMSALGGDYGVAGGFWAKAAGVLELIFKDSFESP